MTAKWLDIMPAIALARGVPVVWRDPDPGDGITPAHGITVSYTGNLAAVYWGNTLCVDDDYIDEIRVDLDTALGFGHALQWFANSPRSEDAPPATALIDALVRRWLSANEDDADRLALARACAAAVAKGTP